MIYFLSFLFFTVQLFGFDYSLKPYKISDGISCFFGLPSEVSSINGGNILNSCYIETKDGYIVIDSGPTYEYAQTSYSIMREIKKLPVKYVINTSIEESHILGNSFYKEQGATLLGSEDYKKYFENPIEISLSKRVSNDAFYHTNLVPLDLYLDEDRKITLGSLSVEIKLIKNNQGGLIVFIPERSILFSGDMVYNNRLLEIKEGDSIGRWQETLKHLKELDWKDTISAHGIMSKRSSFENTEKYLRLLEQKVKESILRKETLEETLNSVLMPSFSETKLYDHLHSLNVKSVYNMLSVDLNLTDNTPIMVALLDEKREPTVLKKVKIGVVQERKIHYVSFRKALKHAKAKHKIVFLKIRSTTCSYCDQLDQGIAKSQKIQKLLNRYFEVVAVNTDYDDIPLDLTIHSTPTLVFIRPDNKDILMKLPGIRKSKEFFDILKEVIDDGYRGGYLKY